MWSIADSEPKSVRELRIRQKLSESFWHCSPSINQSTLWLPNEIHARHIRLHGKQPLNPCAAKWPSIQEQTLHVYGRCWQMSSWLCSHNRRNDFSSGTGANTHKFLNQTVTIQHGRNKDWDLVPPVGVVDLVPVGVVALAPPVGVVALAPPVGFSGSGPSYCGGSGPSWCGELLEILMSFWMIASRDPSLSEHVTSELHVDQFKLDSNLGRIKIDARW